MEICEHIRNSTPYRLYSDDTTGGAVSNRGSRIAELTIFVPKLYENALEDK